MAPSTSWARLYYNVCLVETETSDALDELFATADLKRFVITKLSDRCVVVDGKQKTQLVRALSRRGRAFRIVELAPQTPGDDSGNTQ
ncbi:MAG TPA: hypothetical protein VMW65_14230 [Chloroflexota bacterium]|nr:hypothetical protein [Chloroflexota bacterium]